MRRQGPQIASPGPRWPWCVLARSRLLRRLDRGGGLLEVFQAELQLIGIKLLGAAAELATPQLPDQQLQLLDLGLGCIKFGTNDVPLSQNSIVLGLQ